MEFWHVHLALVFWCFGGSYLKYYRWEHKTYVFQFYVSWVYIQNGLQICIKANVVDLDIYVTRHVEDWELSIPREVILDLKVLESLLELYFNRMKRKPRQPNFYQTTSTPAWLTWKCLTILTPRIYWLGICYWVNLKIQKLWTYVTTNSTLNLLWKYLEVYSIHVLLAVACQFQYRLYSQPMYFFLYSLTPQLWVWQCSRILEFWRVKNCRFQQLYLQTRKSLVLAFHMLRDVFQIEMFTVADLHCHIWSK